MSKSEIIEKIIESIEKNQDMASNKESGIIFTTIGSRIIKYFMSIKELWQLPTADILTSDLMRNMPKKLASFNSVDGKLELIHAVSDLELLVILNELES